MNIPKTPKAFISYSWSTEAHKEQIRAWADQLIHNGIEVQLDQYDLREGHDKYFFMESMVRDPEVTHVLMFTDKKYVERANSRQAGVGTESQIISQEIYEKVTQSKFIPVVCEFDEDGQPYLPIFLKPMIWIDFSTPENASQNWEQLVRVLYNKPQFEKPTRGKAPLYIIDSSNIPSSPATSRFTALKQAVQLGKPGLKRYRRDFLDSCFDLVTLIRERIRPETAHIGEQVLADCKALIPVRDHFIDWIHLEGDHTQESFDNELLLLLEKILAVMEQPPRITGWENAWNEVQRVFKYEFFIYVIATLLKISRYKLLNKLLTTSYLLPEYLATQVGKKFTDFTAFYGDSESLQILSPPNKRLNSPTGEFVKQHATRTDTPFKSLIEADLLAMLMALIQPKPFWHPNLAVYADYRKEFDFFVRATRHDDFKNLATITGISDAELLAKALNEGQTRLNTQQLYFHTHIDLRKLMNIDNLDTLR